RIRCARSMPVVCGFAVRVVPGIELEAHGSERLSRPGMYGDIDALAAIEEDALERLWRREQAAVRAEQVKRNRRFTVAKGEQQAARVAGVEDLQTHPPGRHIPGSIQPAVDERAVAEPAVQAIVRVGRIRTYFAGGHAHVGDRERQAIV